MTTSSEKRGWLVSGRVQGVGFRWSTVQRARELGLDGAVWNRRDGRVEVHASGDSSGLDALGSWLQVGPSSARVEGVDVIPAGDAADGPGFRARL